MADYILNFSALYGQVGGFVFLGFVSPTDHIFRAHKWKTCYFSVLFLWLICYPFCDLHRTFFFLIELRILSFQWFMKLQADENPDVFRTWYPPLEKTLSCLSKLYRCLEPSVFTGLAQVFECLCNHCSSLSWLMKKIFLPLPFF